MEAAAELVSSVAWRGGAICNGVASAVARGCVRIMIDMCYFDRYEDFRGYLFGIKCSTGVFLEERLWLDVGDGSGDNSQCVDRNGVDRGVIFFCVTPRVLCLSDTSSLPLKGTPVMAYSLSRGKA